MGKSHPLALRGRVNAFVEDGHSHRAAARHFRVSPRFVNNLVKLKRVTGSLAPRRQGHLGGGKLNAHGDWVGQRLAQRGVIAHRSNVGFHKSERAEQMVKAKGAWLLFLPP